MNVREMCAMLKFRLPVRYRQKKSLEARETGKLGGDKKRSETVSQNNNQKTDPKANIYEPLWWYRF